MKYLGNKKRLEDFITSSIELKNRKGQKAMDLFCGSGSVSYMFKKHKINTVSNDSLLFCVNRTKSILLDNVPLKNENLENKLFDGFITNNYSDIVNVNIFKSNIAKHIDGSRKYLSDNKSKFNEEEYSYYLSQIIEAADFRSNIMGSYESFYKKGWRKQCEQDWKINDFELINNNLDTKHITFNKDALSFITNCSEYFDFIYLDPPYNARQYSSVFHVLETICLADNPKTTGIVNKRIFNLNEKSKLCSKKQSSFEFEKIVYECSKKTHEIFISYSNEGIVDLKKIEEIMLKNFKKFQIFEYDYRKFKTNNRKLQQNNKVKEFIFHGIK